MTSPDVLGLTRLKQRTGNVLCPQPCWLIHKTAGQDVFLEYRRPAKDSWLAPACLLSFCYHFAISRVFWSFGCYLFATFLLSKCYLSLLAINDQGTLAMYTSPRRKGAPSESRSSLRADSSTLNPTPLAINPSMPDGLANASRPHSKLRTRSPLSGWFMIAFRAYRGF